MRWNIQIFIPVEADEPCTFKTKEEAEKEAKHLSLLQPENIYEVQECQ